MNGENGTPRPSLAGVLWRCAWYGILPWRLYEKKCHYIGDSYWWHLRENARYAWTWIRGCETDQDRQDEITTSFLRKLTKEFKA